MADMGYRQLGRSGLAVSVVGLGCNNFGSRCDRRATRSVVAAALDAGITLFDTADTYGRGESERLLGEALAGRRDEVVLATKFGHDMRGAYGPDWGARGSRRYVVRALEGSLARLGTDHVDLYQYHSPDGRTPLEETLAALDDLVRTGKVRYLGSSNLTGWQVAHADWVARTSHLTPFVAAQNHYSLLERGVEADLVPACRRFGVGILPYFPLANGLLSGKYRREGPPPAGSRLENRPEALRAEVFNRLEPLEAAAADLGRSLLEVAIAGLAARPAVASVIAGATSPEQVQANAAAGSWVPSPGELGRIEPALPPLP